MKKLHTIIVGLALGSALFFSCTKTEENQARDAIQNPNQNESSADIDDEFLPEDGETTEDGRPVVMVFGALIDDSPRPNPESAEVQEDESESDADDQTRSHLGTLSEGKYPNYWSVGDQVSINGESSAPLGDAYETPSKSARFPMAKVVEKVDGYYYVGYPFEAFSSFSEGTATVTLPTAQDYVAGSYDPSAFIMVGKSENQALTFYPKVVVFQVKLQGSYASTVTSVRLDSVDGEPLSGDFTTDYNNASSTFAPQEGKTYTYVSIATPNLSLGSSSVFFVLPAQKYKHGLRITIETADGKVMVFSNTTSMDLSVGNMTALSAPSFTPTDLSLDAPVLEEITPSSLLVQWSSSVPSKDYGKRWRIALYSDSACTELVRECVIYSKPGCWESARTPLRYAVGRLTAAATYYITVEDVGNHIVSDATSITLSSPLSPAWSEMPDVNITTTGVQFAEDFSEIGWGASRYNDKDAGGFYPTNEKNGTNVSGRTFDYLTTTDNATFHWGGATDWGPSYDRFDNAWNGSRLKDWFYYKSAYFKPGYMRLGTLSTTGYLLTPAFPLAARTSAVVDVTIRAAQFSAESSSTWVLAVIKDAAAKGNSRHETREAADFSWPDAADVSLCRTLTFNARTWQTQTVSGLYLSAGDRLVFGFPNGSDPGTEGAARVNISYISVDVKELTDDMIIRDATSLDAFRGAIADAVGASESTNIAGRVVADFSASTIASSWTPIEGYTGTLKGQNHTITGLTKPFFDNLQGTVQNLTLNSTLNQTDDTPYTAIFARQLNGTMSYCTSQGSVTFQPSMAVTGGAERYVAGMVGRVESGSMFHCTNQASVSFPDNNETNDMTINIGGAVASMESSTASSYVSNTGTLSVGIVNATTSNNRTGRIGGVVGNLSGNAVSYFTNSGSVGFTGTIHGQMYMGGIVGYANQAISDCENSGAVTAGGVMNSSANNHYRCVAGIVGWEDGDVALDRNTNTSTAVISNSGTSTGYTLIGGIVGYTKGTISGGGNAASVSYTGHSDGNVCVAGIVGRTVGGTSGTRIGASGVVRNSGAVSLSESSAHSNTTTVYAGGISAHQQSGDVYAQNSGSIAINGLTCTTLLVGGICGSGASNNSYSILSGSSNASTAGITLSGVSAEYRTELDPESESYVNKGGNIYVGGLSGNAYGNVTGTNAGNISLDNTCSANGFIYVGGLCGQLLSSYALGLGSYNVGNVSNACPTDGACGVGSAGDICVGGLVGNANSSTTFSSALYNEGTVSNSASASGGSARVCVGGLVGKAQGLAMTNCHNNGSVSNSGVGSDATAGVRMGGLVGFATGVNNFAGTSSSVNNYNNAAIVETSSSAAIAVGGVVGYADNASTNLAFCQNKADGDIMLGEDDADHTHSQVYVGGVLACTSASTSFDYASNAGDIVFNRLDISGQVFAGGVHGAFTASGAQTITGCVNSGAIKTKTTSNNTDLKSSSTSTRWSFFGGISAVGVTDATQRLYAFGDMEKTFASCTNTGNISIYAALRSCVGGVLARSEICPSGAVCLADIRLYKNGGISSDDYDFNRSLCGGVIGYCPVSTLSDLKYKGNINSRSSSPFAYTGGIVGMTDRDTEFSSCKVGGYLKAAGSGGTGYPGYFCNHSDGGTYVYNFTTSVIETGTILCFPNEDGTEKLNLRRCCGGNSGPTGSLPTIGSID